MLSEAKHLLMYVERLFAALRVTFCDAQLFMTPCIEDIEDNNYVKVICEA
jgi:hypothetical protein